MLRTNLSTSIGLVNGAVGTVRDILYEAGKRPSTDMPAAVMVEFDNYSGPCLPVSNLFQLQR